MTANLYSHRLDIKGMVPTSNSMADQAALYDKIKPELDSLTAKLAEVGGTLACELTRVGSPRKSANPVPAAPVVVEGKATDAPHAHTDHKPHLAAD